VGDFVIKRFPVLFFIVGSFTEITEINFGETRGMWIFSRFFELGPF